MKRIVVKVGTHVITADNGLLNEKRIEHIAFQIADLKKKGIDVILVSSGAVATGKSLIQLSDKTNPIIKRQVLASVGQIDLMHTYAIIFENFNYFCAQILATKEDFRDRQHYLNMKNCFEGLLHDKIIPIVNENDVVSVSELMFTDNDELAGMISSMLNVDALIILTNVDGVFDKNPNEPGANLIKEIDPKTTTFQNYISDTKTTFGRGGMVTKSQIANKLSLLGITTYIANGAKENVLINITKGINAGTKFIAHKNVSSVKKWIAHGKGYEKGSVQINEGAEKVLTDKVSSLLPIGIIKIDGDFEKGDIIEVKNEKGERIGLGKAEYSSKTAEEYLGKQGKKALIHYNYLFLEL